jgi:hypothetical protein
VNTFTVSFRNVHYLSAGATQYGNKAAVAYEYAACSVTTSQLCLVNADCPVSETCVSNRAARYAAPWNHGTAYMGLCTNDATRACTVSTDCAPPGTCDLYPRPANERAKCSFCHMQNGSHSFEPQFTTACTYCHGNETLDTITPAFRNQDNWVVPSTTPKAQVAVFAARLYAAIQAYCAAAADSVSPPAGASYVAYNGAVYPYWYQDTNKNGVVDPGETTAMKFDSRSARAAFNYQYYQKEPGAWAHNNKYIVQVLYDSIQDLGGNLAGLTRPPAP